MWVDADKVQKIVMNLLSNALKFTPSGGKVSLAFDVIPREEAASQFPLTEADTDGQYACISVSDTGPGIPEEEQTKIFGRFYRASSVKNEEGVGIGLHLAREIISGQGGYIKVSSKVAGSGGGTSSNCGTTFSIFLPK